jgi:hypothetical protein
MATIVWLITCKQLPNLSGNTLAQECPQAQRASVQTTLEVLQALTTTTATVTANSNPVPDLDPVAVTQVWSTAFSAVILFFLVGRGVGSVLSLIRRG